MPHVRNSRASHDRVVVDYRVDEKRRAQLQNIRIWRSLARRRRLRPAEQYWTLMDAKSFELETVEGSGLLVRRSQFHGVNNIPGNFRECVRNFPGISAHPGDWLDVMGTAPACPKGGIVYLDTMAQLDEISAEASTLLAATLEVCGPGTLVCANFCYTNPYRSHRKIPFGRFADRLLRFLPERVSSRWKTPSKAYLPEKTSSTQMVTFFFWRER